MVGSTRARRGGSSGQHTTAQGHTQGRQEVDSQLRRTLEHPAKLLRLTRECRGGQRRSTQGAAFLSVALSACRRLKGPFLPHSVL